MKLTVLIDNTTIIDKPYLGEPGVSFLLETEDAKVVFDTGASAIFLSNARKMGVTLTDITSVVISHGHSDHTGGMSALGKLLLREGKRVPIILHPGCFDKKYWRNEDGSIEEIGMPGDRESLERYYTVIPTKQSLKVADSLYFLGAIPRKDPNANDSIGLITDDGNKFIPDFVCDDSAMVFDGKDGLVIINGCAHSGLINILSYTQLLFPGKPIAAVLGGFHMLTKDSVWLEKTANNIKAFEPKRIYPCHCTDEASRAYLRNVFSVGAIGVGSEILFD